MHKTDSSMTFSEIGVRFALARSKLPRHRVFVRKEKGTMGFLLEVITALHGIEPEILLRQYAVIQEVQDQQIADRRPERFQ